MGGVASAAFERALLEKVKEFEQAERRFRKAVKKAGLSVVSSSEVPEIPVHSLD